MSAAQAFEKTVAVISGITVLVGINGMLRPVTGLALFGIPPPAAPEAKKLAITLVRVFMIRHLVFGLVCGTIWYQGDKTLSGWAMVIGTLNPLVDGFAALAHGGNPWIHWASVPVIFGVGAKLLSWLG